ncbi:MAG: adenylate/guanylate cyclase domain-containing protein [Nocardioidaceae bacterium]
MDHPPPSRTVTMLFSDIESSTRLLQRLGGRYRQALDEQRRILRGAWSRWDGQEMGTEGDSFFVVFDVARNAVSAAAEAQRELAATSWPDGAQVAVRMGLHTGEPILHDGGFVGIDVHRAARIAAAANGGQVLLSDSTERLVRGGLPDELGLLDLGSHRLKDLDGHEHLYQLTASGTPATFPPVKSLGSASSLPTYNTPLIGRHEDIAALRDVVLAPEVRLLTLTGVGGSGKTRVAISLAAELVDQFPDGIHFVSLATESTEGAMWKKTADSLGVPAESSPRDALLAHVAHSRRLVILDNLEQIAGAAEVVSDLLSAAVNVSVITTTRRPLHVLGEHEHEVPPLEVPSEGIGVGDSAAVELFCHHARMVKDTFTLTADSAAAVGDLCRRLDGLPLAIELAAARSKTLSPKAILTRLSSSLDLPSIGAGRPARQRTMRETIAWSYDLLPEDQQVLLRRLSVFAGDSDLTAVAAVTGSHDDPVDEIAELIDASLALISEGPDDEPRVGLLRTVSDFAFERLVEAGEHDALRDAHASYYLQVARRLAPQMWGANQRSAIALLTVDQSNFAAALDWTLPPPDGRAPLPDRARIGLRLCSELRWFLENHGNIVDASRWTSRALELDSGEDSVERCATLLMWADMRAAGSDTQHLRALEEALEISLRIGDREVMGGAYRDLAVWHGDHGDLERARRLFDEGIAVDPKDLWLFNHKAHVLCLQHDYAGAIASREHAVELARQDGDEISVAWSSLEINNVLVLLGRVSEARLRLEGMVDGVLRLRHHMLAFDLVVSFAIVHAAEDHAERAARLIGAVHAFAVSRGVTERYSDDETWMRQMGLADARASLSPGSWERNFSRGSEYSLEEALADALAHPTEAESG